MECNEQGVLGTKLEKIMPNFKEVVQSARKLLADVDLELPRHGLKIQLDIPDLGPGVEAKQCKPVCSTMCFPEGCFTICYWDCT